MTKSKTLMLAVILIAATSKLVYAAEPVFLDMIEETRGFTATATRSAKCTDWYASGATIGRLCCENAVFHQVGDSIIRYQDYTMPLDGKLRFSIRRNTGNPGWSWLFIATLKRPGNTSVIRTFSTGAADRGSVLLLKGERVVRIEFQADKRGPASAHIPMVKVWSTATATYQSFIPIVH